MTGEPSVGRHPRPDLRSSPAAPIPLQNAPLQNDPIQTVPVQNEQAQTG